MAQYLWQTGSVIIAILAGLQLFYTFFTDKFSSRNQLLVKEMQTATPVLTKKVTMWNAWMGFNGSHSAGGIFIGVMNFYLALQYFSVLKGDHFFFIFNILTLCFYVWLAKKYWFRTPLMGLTMTLTCYIISYILILAGS